jgi:anti-sigma factor RsiW
MSCAALAGKLEAYFDGQLPEAEARAFGEHLRTCATCTAEGLRLVQQKRAVQAAGLSFTPDPVFRARIQKSIAPPPPWRPGWRFLAAAVALVLVAGTVLLSLQHGRGSDRQLLSELVDQHVATLASPHPVDVVSTDRHTVKPWFEGKIPFSFNLPELQGSPFELIGGKVCYLSQSPGAELIFRVRQHQISVFIFREQGLAAMPEDRTALSFEVRSWSHAGLRYFVIGDASPADLDKLSELIKGAG